MAINAEVLLVQWLSGREELDGVPVSLNVPATRPARFVTVDRTGGNRNEHRDLPAIAVQVWAQSRVAAGDLAGTVADVLEQAVKHPQIGRVNITGPYNFPDLESGTARYQIVCELVTVE